MAVLMELSRILIRELVDHQIIELREVDPGANGSTVEEIDDDPSSIFGDESDDMLEAEADDSGLRTFPIVIGLPEAQAIERRLKGIPIKRPQTHDLLATVIRGLGGTLDSICINDLNEHTFYAELRIRMPDGETVSIDSRPSDAIAIGIAEGVPIYVEEHVLASASQDPFE